MPTYSVLIHTDGPALWPTRRPASECQAIRATNPPEVWWGTYQGIPSAPGGTIFQKRWWATGETRYDAADPGLVNRCVARWLSFDTAKSERETAAFTACVVGELLPDYRLVIRDVWRQRLIFPDLDTAVRQTAERHRRDDKLHGIIIEDADSGTSLIQTLQASSPDWLRRLVLPFSPTVSKEERAKIASVWCRNGCVLLPWPGEAAIWLETFERELFSFPGSAFADQVDAFSQLIIFLEHYLALGYRGRMGA